MHRQDHRERFARGPKCMRCLCHSVDTASCQVGSRYVPARKCVLNRTQLRSTGLGFTDTSHPRLPHGPLSDPHASTKTKSLRLLLRQSRASHRGGLDLVQVAVGARLHARHVVHLLRPLAPLHAELLLQGLPLLPSFLLPSAHLSPPPTEPRRLRIEQLSSSRRGAVVARTEKKIAQGYVIFLLRDGTFGVREKVEALDAFTSHSCRYQALFTLEYLQNSMASISSADS